MLTWFCIVPAFVRCQRVTRLETYILYLYPLGIFRSGLVLVSVFTKSCNNDCVALLGDVLLFENEI